MAIAPIDLQTLYTQLETVSKTVASHGQGVQMQNAVHNSKEAQKNLEQKKTISATGTLHDEETLKVKDEKRQHQNQSSSQNRRSAQNQEQDLEPETEPTIVRIKDSNLGQHIDLMG